MFSWWRIQIWIIVWPDVIDQSTNPYHFHFYNNEYQCIYSILPLVEGLSHILYLFFHQYEQWLSLLMMGSLSSLIPIDCLSFLRIQSLSKCWMRWWKLRWGSSIGSLLLHIASINVVRLKNDITYLDKRGIEIDWNEFHRESSVDFEKIDLAYRLDSNNDLHRESHSLSSNSRIARSISLKRIMVEASHLKYCLYQQSWSSFHSSIDKCPKWYLYHCFAIEVRRSNQ